jgi:hypothetical protein
MHLTTFEHEIDPVIAERGRAYAASGQVGALEDLGDGACRALVQGTRPYVVSVILTSTDEVTNLDCDCPYDGGPVCKHEAAVLFTMRRQRGAERPVASPPPAGLQELLTARSKEQLVHLLLVLAERSDLVAGHIQLMLEADRRSIQEQVTAGRALIRSSIRAHADRHGFVAYRAVGGATEGAAAVVTQARLACDAGQYETAVRLALCLVQELAALLSTADDSDGLIGGLIEDSLACLQTAAEASAIAGYSDILMPRVLEVIGDGHLQGWPDWQVALLEAASHWVTTPALRGDWDRAANRLVDAADGWSARYLAERVDEIRLNLIAALDGQEAAAAFLRQHLEHPRFREMAVREALDDGRYEEAVALAEAGEREAEAQGLHGLVLQWTKLRYDICRRAGWTELQCTIGVQLVTAGEYDFYPLTKAVCPSDRWPDVYRELLALLERNPRVAETYARILVEEREWSRLLAHCGQYPARIERFYPYLALEFPDQVTDLFRQHAISTAERANNRGHYRDVCGILRLMARAGAARAALELSAAFRAQYARKPAFREELLHLEQSLVSG